ncbi:het-domain protein [Fusarium tjaetaba]|uniref:Het-domain protein n=1 Tax=Fusarium tjaetaba TaxID=1567544 RepID=A0A8H5RFJ9_9HYPO|nr:het-domain protein [Fusarium tjaetaba]KAF5632292.1 het-domain protein [Fusarium tjaetaba]
MAEVYCKARQVIVWLGEATSDSDLAMQKISEVAEGDDIPAEQDNIIVPESIAALLKRTWFRRIWVLQEVAAAQHVLIVCGASQIDGYAFCLGLAPYIDASEGFEPVSSIEYLIRGSIFRPKYTKTDSGLITLGIRSLGELMDMYHAHEATEPLDKVFALLGMSTDGSSASELKPNYSISWDVLFCRLTTFLLGPKVSVKTSNSDRAAIISGQGTVLGKVTSVAPRRSRNRDFRVNMTYTTPFESFWRPTSWDLDASVKRAKEGDILCLLEGASHPMLIRQEGDCFSVILISLSTTPRQPNLPLTTRSHKFVLIWNLEDSSKTVNDSQLETWLDMGTLEYVDPHPETVIQNSHLLLLSAHVLVGACRFEAAIDLFHKAVEGYDYHLAKNDAKRIECLAAMAVAYGSLQRWDEAKGVWESIIRVCYASSDCFTQTTDFLDNLLPILDKDEKDYDGKRWQAVRDAINAKRSQTPIQEDRIPDLVEYLDSQVMNILVDQQDHWPVTRRESWIAASCDESSREEAVKVFLDRLSDLELPEQVFVAAARNILYGQKLTAMLLGRQGPEAQITQAVFRSAAVNSRSKRALIFSLLEHEGMEVCSGIDTNSAWATLPPLMLDSEPYIAKMDVLYLAKLYSKTDKATLLRMLISATDPLDLPHLRRGLYQFAWDEYKFRRLDELVEMLPPALEDIIATLTHIMLSNGEHAVQQVIELARRSRPDTTRTKMVNEEIVNGCSKIIETRSPAELLQFLDSLYELGVSFSYQGKVESPPTQSSILPTTLSKDPRFLKTLIEKKLVSPQMQPFTILSLRWHLTWNAYINDGVSEERCPPAGMPDWPLYCAIVLAADSEVIDFLCSSGARVDQDLSGTSPHGREAAIIERLQQTTAFSTFNEDFRNLRRVCFKMAKAQLDSTYMDGGYKDATSFKLLWEMSFDQAWSVGAYFQLDPLYRFQPASLGKSNSSCAMMESPSEIVLSTPGYYGPGSITAWYCIVASTAISWIWNPAHRFLATSDFLAAILYPFIAMIHFAIQLWNYPSDKTQYLRGNLMHILIGNGDEGPVSAKYDYQYKNQVLFDKPGPDMFEIFPRVISIDAALRINDNCFWLCLIALGFLLVEHRKNWTEQQLQGFESVGKCLLAGVVLPIINSVFLLITCGDSRTFWIPVESTLFRFMAVTVGMCPVMVAFFIYLPFSTGDISFSGILPETRSITRFPMDLVGNLFHRIRKVRLLHFGLGILYLVFIGILAWGTVNTLRVAYPIQLFIPAVGISIFEMEQVASLFGGMVVLFYNIHSVYYPH